jgi:hypothetical protein
MNKMDHLMAENNEKIIKTDKRGKSHQKKIFKKTLAQVQQQKSDSKSYTTTSATTTS